MSYEIDIKIDEDALDVECLEQPQLMMKYARLQAKLQNEEDMARENLELVKSELDMKIRKSPERYKIEKVTNPAVEAAIKVQNKYKEAHEEYMDARFENNVAKGAVRSIDARKTMLELLVKLHGQQYFAGPRVPRDLSAERQKKQSKANKTVRIRRNT